MNQEEIFKSVIFKTVSGSRSYGLNTPSSDEDTLGVFVQRPENLLGVSENVVHYRGKETDENLKSLSNFMKHAYDGSSFWIEPFFVRESDILVCDSIFRPFIDNRTMFLTQALISKSIGFMKGMSKRSRTQEKIEGTEKMSPEEAALKLRISKQKNMCHSIRVGNMLIEMLSNDELTLNVYRSNKEERERLLDIKTGKIPFEETWDESDELVRKIDELALLRMLPQTADADLLDSMLVQVYKEYWKQQKWI